MIIGEINLQRLKLIAVVPLYPQDFTIFLQPSFYKDQIKSATSRLNTIAE